MKEVMKENMKLSRTGFLSFARLLLSISKGKNCILQKIYIKCIQTTALKQLEEEHNDLQVPMI